MLFIESTTAEKLQVLVTTTADPTGTPPLFAVSTTGEPGAFTAGNWVGAWDPITGEVRAETPLAGAGQVLDLVQGSTNRLFARWTVGTETPTVVASVVRTV